MGQLVERYAILIVWLAVAVLFYVWKPDTFGTLNTARNVMGSQASLLVLTLGLLLVLTAGEFDLSIGAAFSMGVSMLAFLDVKHEWPIALAIVAVVALAVLLGVINAVIVVKVGVPSIVTTLGTSTLLSGLLLGVVGPKVQSGIDKGFISLVRDKWFGLPHSFYFALALTFIVWYVLRHTPLGRYLVFVGKGREVARLAGVRVDAIRFGALVSTSVIAAIAGMLLAGTTGSAQIGIGNGYLLPAYAAAFLGATAIRPGEFNAWGSWVSVYFLLTGITGLAIAGYSGWPEQVFYGGALVTAVVLSQLAVKLRARGELAAVRT